MPPAESMLGGHTKQELEICSRPGSCGHVCCSWQAVTTQRWPGYQVHSQEEAIETDSQWNWKKRRHRGESTAH